MKLLRPTCIFYQDARAHDHGGCEGGAEHQTEGVRFAPRERQPRSPIRDQPAEVEGLADGERTHRDEAIGYRGSAPAEHALNMPRLCLIRNPSESAI